VGEDPAWRWWRERRPPARYLHFDTAAAGRSSLATLRATAAHAEREATVGREMTEPLLRISPTSTAPPTASPASARLSSP
jgi:hypothetical protein